MLARVEILCFAASYSVALALELSRLAFRSGLRGVVMLGFAAAGLLAHTIYLGHRAMQTSIPLSSEFDWYLVTAWALVWVYLWLTYYHPKNPIGLFVLPVVLALVAAATFLADREPFPASRASQLWGAVHGVFLLLGTVSVTLAFVAGVMYLLHAAQLKRKLPAPRGFQLPSLEWCERINTRAILSAAAMLSAGVLSGAVLNVVNRIARPDEQLPWTDPVIVTSLVTFAWLLAAALFAGVYRPARRGRKVAYLTLASFVFLLASLGVALLGDTHHGGRDASARGQHGTRGPRPAPAVALSWRQLPGSEPGRGSGRR